jgi:methyl-accepting chemotaxis protein
MSNSPFKRRNYFIKKNLQGKMIVGYFLFMVGGCFLFTCILAALSADTLTVIYQNNDIQMGQTPLMLIRQVLAAHWILIVAGGGFLVIATMFITHRVAGPLYRIEMTVRNMSSGRLSDVIHLRKTDEGKEIVEHLNDFNKELSKKMQRIDVCAHNIESLLSQCSVLNSSGNAHDEVTLIHKGIAGQTDIIRKIVSTFQLLDE